MIKKYFLNIIINYLYYLFYLKKYLNLNKRSNNFKNLYIIKKLTKIFVEIIYL